MTSRKVYSTSTPQKPTHFDGHYQDMVYNAANSQQSNTYQYPIDKKVQKLFEVPVYNYFLSLLAKSMDYSH